MIQFGGEMFRRDNDDIWGRVVDMAADPSTDMALDRRMDAALDQIEWLQEEVTRLKAELHDAHAAMLRQPGTVTRDDLRAAGVLK